MPSRNYPNLGIEGGWLPEEDGWGDKLNADLRKLSVLTQTSVIGRVSEYPASPADGQVYVNTATQKIGARDAGAWVEYAPQKGWLVYDRSEGVYLTFDGAAWNELETGGGTELPDPTGNNGKFLAVSDDAYALVPAPAGSGGSGGESGNVEGSDTGPVGRIVSGPPAYRYWQVYVLAPFGGEPYTALSNLEFRTEVGVAEQAIGGLAIASGSLGGANAPAAAFDGDNNTSFISTGVMPNWIGYRFAEPVIVLEVAMRNRADGYYYQVPETFEVRGSHDGVAWETVWEVSDAGFAGNVIEQRVFTSPLAGQAPVVTEVYPTKIAALNDVSDVVPQDGQALVWDADAEQYVPGTVAGGGGGSGGGQASEATFTKPKLADFPVKVGVDTAPTVAVDTPLGINIFTTAQVGGEKWHVLTKPAPATFPYDVVVRVNDVNPAVNYHALGIVLRNAAGRMSTFEQIDVDAVSKFEANRWNPDFSFVNNDLAYNFRRGEKFPWLRVQVFEAGFVFYVSKDGLAWNSVLSIDNANRNWIGEVTEVGFGVKASPTASQYTGKINAHLLSFDTKVPTTVPAGGGGALGKVAAEATLAPVLTNGYTDLGNGYQPVRAFKTGRLVTLTGVMKGPDGVAAFTLPAGWRPAQNLHGVDNHGDVLGRWDLFADGRYLPAGGNPATFACVNVTYEVAEADGAYQMVGGGSGGSGAEPPIFPLAADFPETPLLGPTPENFIVSDDPDHGLRMRLNTRNDYAYVRAKAIPDPTASWSVTMHASVLMYGSGARNGAVVVVNQDKSKAFLWGQDSRGSGPHWYNYNSNGTFAGYEGFFGDTPDVPKWFRIDYDGPTDVATLYASLDGDEWIPVVSDNMTNRIGSRPYFVGPGLLNASGTGSQQMVMTVKHWSDTL